MKINFKKFFKDVGHLAHEVVKAAARVEGNVIMAPLLPFLPVMKTALNRKGISSSDLPDTAAKFAEHIVKPSKHFDFSAFRASARPAPTMIVRRNTLPIFARTISALSPAALISAKIGQPIAAINTAPPIWAQPPAGSQAGTGGGSGGGGNGGGAGEDYSDSPSIDATTGEEISEEIPFNAGAETMAEAAEEAGKEDKEFSFLRRRHHRRHHRKGAANFDGSTEQISPQDEEKYNIIDDIVTIILDFIRGLKQKQKSGEQLTPQEAAILKDSTAASDTLIKAGMAINPPDYSNRPAFIKMLLSGKGLIILVVVIALIAVLIFSRKK